jgi:hypothetical protein
VAVADTVFETEKLTDGDLVPVADDEVALVPVTDADSDLLFVIDADSDLLFVIDADSDRLIVLESDSDLEIVRDGDTLLESVTSTDTDADILRLTLDVCVSDGSTDAEAVSDGVKLGDTGLFVTDGVIDGEGINSV